MYHPQISHAVSKSHSGTVDRFLATSTVDVQDRVWPTLGNRRGIEQPLDHCDIVVNVDTGLPTDWEMSGIGITLFRSD
ncbi:MAG: hypothetical protein DMF76_08580 [Acidobacteria bacterium]|nr:MAG: hypothetical protein DMF76_08580 [Acidobacteriota bacterium]